ncbi:hypothetical protein [Candidatus Mycoplasma haematohominis]|uniref:hypothetical protein n=1 Tax=Candidatus Mycoplasma haematohominis TaxID=1494318 RepID=UPI001C0A745A|nr:hypothetical protein [Candidatus Mycoplasma haemohominis]
MSTQAIGAAAAGTAVVGGGGALAAYAAGAFNGETKYESFDDYFQKTLSKTHKYVSETDYQPIETKIGESAGSNTYKTSLTTHWSKMGSNDVPADGEPTQKPETIDTSWSNKTDVAKWTFKWCNSRKTKKPSGDEKMWIREEIERNLEWQTFKSVCLEERPKQQ